MKKYNTEFIKKYITEHKDEIESVECGMREDWFWTAETVYKNGDFCKRFDWNKKHISVAYIDGSTWATPVMNVNFKDGREEVVPCYEDDGESESEERIANQKMFAAMTFGMDYKL